MTRFSLMAVLATLALAGAAHAQNLTWRFDWQGGGGYSLRGALAFDAAMAERDVVVAEDVDCFVIEGFRDGAPIGRWALGMLTEDTTWRLTFHPQRDAFAVYGPDALMPQAWNMDGFGTDCGAGGFGFNIGNAAQDLCLDGRLLQMSQVAPDRPFPAQRDDAYRFPSDACRAPMLMGAFSPVPKEPPHVR
ncbi:hypothetical protein [Salipiger marinus]|uniref:Uncharacterized protein n=1 Tax=Salipiger marinus TaxID=555512 RepID=A0A1G8Q156_9RHOB|nr:hypothetical protein [Salipiger marinus]SDI98484.1 hypothetical protein SAMN04487993_101436 [Salipiger marinus]